MTLLFGLLIYHSTVPLIQSTFQKNRRFRRYGCKSRAGIISDADARRFGVVLTTISLYA